MAFLTINGITIKTATGAMVKRREIGRRTRGLGGSLLNTRRTVKRRWEFKTPPISSSDAEFYRVLLEGGAKGHYWNFNSGLISDKGLLPNADASGVLQPGTAADGDTVKILSGANKVAASKFGAGSVWMWPNFENLLPADERDAEGTPASDYTAVSAATLATSTTHFWQGAQSLKVTTTAGAVRGASTSAVYILQNTDFCISVYLKGDSGGETVTLSFSDSVSGVLATEDVVLESDAWLYTHVLVTASAGSPSGTLSIIDTNASDAQTWYADGFQVAGQEGGPP